MIRAVFLLLVMLCVAPLQAVMTSFKPYGFEVNLPESTGWAPVGAPDIPGVTVLVFMQNPTRNAVFVVDVLNNPPSTNLRDPNTVRTIETTLKSFRREFVGSAMIPIGGVEWRQYRVTTADGGNGLVRYASV